MIDHQAFNVGAATRHAIEAVPGLEYLAGSITMDAAAEIMAHIDDAPWSDELPRLVQHYGFTYDYRARAVSEDMRAAPVPDWAMQIGTRLVTEGIFACVPDQVIVNAYLPGQGISFTSIVCPASATLSPHSRFSHRASCRSARRAAKPRLSWT